MRPSAELSDAQSGAAVECSTGRSIIDRPRTISGRGSGGLWATHTSRQTLIPPGRRGKNRTAESGFNYAGSPRTPRISSRRVRRARTPICAFRSRRQAGHSRPGTPTSILTTAACAGAGEVRPPSDQSQATRVNLMRSRSGRVQLENLWKQAPEQPVRPSRRGRHGSCFGKRHRV
jgi:hypothetical protein